MRLSFRISYVMLIISVCTITLLTVLMHFKYHNTRVTLINEKLNVVSAGIAYPINNALLLGIDIKNIKELGAIIKKAKEFDTTISDIVVFAIDKDSITPAFTTSEKPLNNTDKAQLLRQVRISKTKNWKGTFQGDIKFSGITLKDVANQERAGIVIYYDLKQNNIDEAEEIGNLYKRLGLGLLLAAFLNFMIGLINTKELSKIIKSTESSINSVLKNPNHKIDLGQISDPGIRSQLRLMINKISDFSKYLNKAEGIIKQFQLNPEHKRDVK